MKKIIDNKLYDTEKAEKIFNFRQKRKTGNFGNYNFYSWFNVEVYKTKKNNYFFYGYIKDSLDKKEFLEVVSEENVKDVMKELDPDKYIKLFGDIEEA